jgi:hypothetical protein
MSRRVRLPRGASPISLTALALAGGGTARPT